MWFICADILDGTDSTLEDYTIPTLRYSQVNKEARREVLRKREVLIVPLGSDSKPIFVNWDRDLFQLNPYMPLPNIIGKYIMSRVKKIAFRPSLSTNPPGLVLQGHRAPEVVDNPFFYSYGGLRESQSTFGSYAVWLRNQPFPALFPSVHQVIYLIGYSPIHSTYVLRRPDSKEYLVYGLANNKYSKCVAFPGDPALPTNEYGFHTIDPTAYPYNDLCKPVGTFGFVGSPEMIPFLEWLDRLRHRATTCILPEIFRRQVELRMMMYLL